MAKQTKKQKALAEAVDANKLYGIDEAIELIKSKGGGAHPSHSLHVLTDSTA